MRLTLLAALLFAAFCTLPIASPATGQTIPPPPDPALRIYFLGNSLTRSIGWRDADKFDRPWGMAASQPDKDFAHRTQLLIAAATGRVPEIRTASIDLIYPQHFDNARTVGEAFDPDVLVLEVGDAAQQMSRAEYHATMRQIVGWFPRAKVIVTGVWYVARLEEYNREFATEIGAPFVPLNDLNVPANWGDPLCATRGSWCDHPGDAGFAAIAARLAPVLLALDVPPPPEMTTALYLPWTPNE
jgi:hypothetical protein